MQSLPGRNVSASRLVSPVLPTAYAMNFIVYLLGRNSQCNRVVDRGPARGQDAYFPHSPAAGGAARIFTHRSWNCKQNRALMFHATLQTQAGTLRQRPLPLADTGSPTPLPIGG